MLGRDLPIPIGEFGAHVELLHQNENKGFTEEYKVQYINYIIYNTSIYCSSL